MHTTVRSFTIAMLVLATAGISVAQGQGQGQGGPGWGRHGGQGHGCGQALAARFDQIEPASLSAVESEAVLHLREEEKLARDVYSTLGSRWQLPMFDRIARAEQRHMDHVKLVLDEYGMADPVVDDQPGVFTDPDLAALYDTLVARGEASVEEALVVGATVEDLDLADLEPLLLPGTNDHVRLVAQNLARGSRDHLRAFNRALTSRNLTYTPRYLDQSTFDQIVTSPRERGTLLDENGQVLASCGQGGRGRHGGRRGSPNGDGACPCGQPGAGQGNGAGSCDGTGPHGRRGGTANP